MAGDIFEFMAYEVFIVLAAQFQSTEVGVVKGKVEICEFVLEKAQVKSGVVGD